MRNIKDYLSKKVGTLYANGYDFYELPGELINVDSETWPYDEENEPLDMENFEWLEITDDHIKIACGGDWQEPKILEIKLVGTELVVTSVEDGFSDGLDVIEFDKILGL